MPVSAPKRTVEPVVAPMKNAPVQDWIAAIRDLVDQMEAAIGDQASSNGHKRSGKHTGLTEAIGEILAEGGPMTAPQIRMALEHRGVPFTANALSVYLTRRFRRLGVPPQSLWTLRRDSPGPEKSRSRQRKGARAHA